MAVRGMAKMLGCVSKMEWWGLRPDVMVTVAAKVKTQALVVMGLTESNLLNISTHAVATDGVRTRLVATMSAGVAVAVGLTVVGMVAVLAQSEVQLVHVVVQAVREVC